MGVNISDIVVKNEITLKELTGKKLGVDSHNMMYQFLASIRGQDGLPLTDSHGNVTSHLSGLFYRTISLMNDGVFPVFVFDGMPSELKKETLKKRREVRTDAEKKATEALHEGSLEEAQKMGSRALKLTKEMILEAKTLLKLMGIPLIEAPEEGEAQASVMVEKKQLNGVISQDFDCLLFGASELYRNIGFSGKRKVAGKNFYVEVKPQRISLEETLTELKLTRQKLIWLGILVGTDFNEKFPRIGPKTALKLVRECNSFEDVIKETEFTPDFDYLEIEKMFSNPTSKEIELKDLEFKAVDKKALLEFLVEKHDFSLERVEGTIDSFIRKRDETEKQKSMAQWFG
jgi:flap endonuclease-1